jgi:hypothetical protein
MLNASITDSAASASNTSLITQDGGANTATITNAGTYNNS